MCIRDSVYSDPAAVGAATPEESEAEAADAEETVPSPAASSQPGAAGSERAQERRRRGEHATADRIEAVPDISDAEWATMTIAERRKAREEAARKQAEAASGDDEAHEEEEAR